MCQSQDCLMHVPVPVWSLVPGKKNGYPRFASHALRPKSEEPVRGVTQPAQIPAPEGGNRLACQWHVGEERVAPLAASKLERTAGVEPAYLQASRTDANHYTTAGFPGTWYQVPGTKYLVPGTWYWLPNHAILVTKSCDIG